MKKKYSFVNAKPVPLGKIDYWFRTGQCGCKKPKKELTLKDVRGNLASRIRQCKLMEQAF